MTLMSYENEYTMCTVDILLLFYTFLLTKCKIYFISQNSVSNAYLTITHLKRNNALKRKIPHDYYVLAPFPPLPFLGSIYFFKRLDVRMDDFFPLPTDDDDDIVVFRLRSS